MSWLLVVLVLNKGPVHLVQFELSTAAECHRRQAATAYLGVALCVEKRGDNET